MGADSDKATLAIGCTAATAAARQRGRANFAQRAGQAHGGRAFTIAELVVVLTIIALLAGMALPRFGGMIARQRADQAAERLAAALTLARRHAMAESRAQSVEADILAEQVRLPNLRDPDRPDADFTLHLADDPCQADLVFVDFGVKSGLEFDAYGAPGSTVLFRIAVGDERRDVTVAAGSGAVTISQPAEAPK